MKIIYSVFLFALFSSQSLSQLTIDQLLIPEPGDSVELFLDVAPGNEIEITAPGGDQAWFWTLDNAVMQSVVFDTNDRTDLFPFADTKATTAAFDNYYNMEEDGWLLYGQVGQDPFGLGLNVNLFYQPWYREYFAPVIYEDSLVQSFDVFTGIPLSLVPDSILNTLPLIPDSMRARIVTQTVDKVDAWGILHINEGEEDVLRIRQERRLAVRVEIKISILPWTDVTDALAEYLGVLPFDVNLNDTIVGYQFLAEGYTLPLAQVTLDSIGGIGTITYQQPVVSSLRDIDRIAAFDIYPNPASEMVTIDYDTGEDISQVRIYDITGRQVRSVSLTPSGKINMSVGDFSLGTFIVTLWNSSGQLSGMQKLNIAR